MKSFTYFSTIDSQNNQTAATNFYEARPCRFPKQELLQALQLPDMHILVKTPIKAIISIQPSLSRISKRVGRESQPQVYKRHMSGCRRVEEHLKFWKACNCLIGCSKYIKLHSFFLSVHSCKNSDLKDGRFRTSMLYNLRIDNDTNRSVQIQCWYAGMTELIY